MSGQQMNALAHIHTCTLRNDLAAWLPNYFQSNLYCSEAFLLLKSETASTFICPKNFFSGTLQVAPFIFVIHTLLNVAKQVILASLSQES